MWSPALIPSLYVACEPTDGRKVKACDAKTGAAIGVMTEVVVSANRLMRFERLAGYEVFVGATELALSILCSSFVGGGISFRDDVEITDSAKRL